ncbi:hypothetical protein [Actinomadura fibrosa]|uniref:Guanylate cyclase domain-containing protein n=1 Tax=Actinomadura fibrosa TaxID=111802 RepID=A0ABW2XIW2_9ACTN|nr:hypothetical protein [Actinomadura fibrosa]
MDSTEALGLAEPSKGRASQLATAGTPVPESVRRSGPVLEDPVPRIILAVDMEGSTARKNPVKIRLRQLTYSMLDEAMQETGIEDRHLERLTDRGDGVLVLVRPVDEVPKTRLLDTFVPTLCALLTRYNADLGSDSEERLRLRLVVHVGEIHDDGKGFCGEDLDVAFRLLDAPRVKRTLNTIDGPLIVVVSEEIYRSIICQGYSSIDARAYEKGVGVRVGGRTCRGRLHIPAII